MGLVKNYDLNLIKNTKDSSNFYNYNTNNHRHICEIQQELDKYSNEKVNFSFNPHILPNYRGMMSTIYCNLKNEKTEKNIYLTLENYYRESFFVKILTNNNRLDFFSVQNTNNCLITLYNILQVTKLS